MVSEDQEMNVNELGNEKRRMEDKVRLAVKEFEGATGMQVEDIELRRNIHKEVVYASCRVVMP